MCETVGGINFSNDRSKSWLAPANWVMPNRQAIILDVNGPVPDRVEELSGLPAREDRRATTRTRLSSWWNGRTPPLTRRLVRGVLVVATALGLAVGWGLPATAHAELVTTDPALGVSVDDAPSEIRLTFNRDVRLLSGGITVTSVGGEEVEGLWELVGLDAVFTPRQVIPTGSVLVDWGVVSEDGHPIHGTLIFHVQEQTATLPDQDVAPARPVGSVLANAVMYLGLLLGGGVALFLVHVHDGGRDWLPLRRLAILLLLLGFAGVVISLTVKTIEATGRFRFEDLPAGALPALVTAILGIGIVVPTIDGRRRVSVTSGVVLTVASLVFVGHTRSFGPTPLVATADLVHVTAGAFWAGGLTALAIVCRQRRNDQSAKQSMVVPAIGMVRRFSTYAGWSIAAVVGSGSVLAWRILGSWDNLIGTAHGRFVLIKIAIVAIAVTIGTFNRFRLVSAVAASASVRSVSRLGTTTTVEAVALALLLVVAGALVEQNPRASSRPDGMALAGPVQTSLGPYHLSLSLDPGVPGANQLQIDIRDPDGRPASLPTVPEVSINGVGGEVIYETHVVGERYESVVHLPTQRVWLMEVRLGALTDAVTTFTFDPRSAVLVPGTGILGVNPRMPIAPGTPAAVVYLTVVSAEGDELTGVSSAACDQASFHETLIGSDGAARMRPRPTLALPSGAPVVFTSGSFHIMCEGVDPGVSVGDLVPFTLTTSRGASLNLFVRAVTYADLID